MIRLATREDAPRILEILDRLRSKSAYRRFAVDWFMVKAMVADAITHDAIYVGLVRERVVSVIICAVKPLWWNRNVGIASDVFFFSARREHTVHLLKKLLEFAAKRGAARVECGISSMRQVSAVENAYIFAGFRREGSLFVRDLLEEPVCLASSTM